jgi:hypothetical protein
MVTYDARPSAFTQLSTTADWESLLSVIGVPEAAIDGSAALGHWMAPSLDTGGRNAVIDAGQCVIKGQLWRCDASVSTPIPAASAQNRIDRLVLRLTRGAATSAAVVAPAVVTGTPSGSPALPALTQTPTGIWEYPVCHWTSTSAGALQSLIDDRRITNDTWHDMRPLSNGFVGTVAGRTPPQYRFSDDCKFVEVAGELNTPPTTGNYNGVNFFTLPPNYAPKYTVQKWFCGGVSDGIATPMIYVGTIGNMQLNLMPSSLAQSTATIWGRFPLDDTNGFITS